MEIHDITGLPEQWSELKEAKRYDYRYLPMVAACCRRLGLVEVVDTAVQSQMQVQPGLVVQAMVLDVLSGWTPLYRLESFLARQDIKLLLREAVDVSTHSTTTRWLDP